MTATSSVDFLIEGRHLTVSTGLLEKYNQPGPRYTSYLTAPDWGDRFGESELRQVFREADSRANPAPVSLYFHLPFCQSLCLYCGCNVVISKKRDVAVPYIERLKREIDLVSRQVTSSRKVEQLHWGGGTPTFLAPDQIEDL
jgi:oxygen-independent coproporphyrinogen-3 oxidase